MRVRTALTLNRHGSPTPSQHLFMVRASLCGQRLAEGSAQGSSACKAPRTGGLSMGLAPNGTAGSCSQFPNSGPLVPGMGELKEPLQSPFNAFEPS